MTWERKVYPDPAKPGLFNLRAAQFEQVTPFTRRMVRCLHRDGFQSEADALALDCDMAWIGLRP